MIRLRYTQWDGSQRVRLNADQVFEKLSEYLSYTDDVQQALEWLMRQGAEWEGDVEDAAAAGVSPRGSIRLHRLLSG